MDEPRKRMAYNAATTEWLHPLEPLARRKRDIGAANFTWRPNVSLIVLGDELCHVERALTSDTENLRRIDLLMKK